jgi:hypothetical protein
MSSRAAITKWHRRPEVNSRIELLLDAAARRREFTDEGLDELMREYDVINYVTSVRRALYDSGFMTYPRVGPDVDAEAELWRKDNEGAF